MLKFRSFQLTVVLRTSAHPSARWLPKSGIGDTRHSLNDPKKVVSALNVELLAGRPVPAGLTTPQPGVQTMGLFARLK